MRADGMLPRAGKCEAVNQAFLLNQHFKAQYAWGIIIIVPKRGNFCFIVSKFNGLGLEMRYLSPCGIVCEERFGNIREGRYKE
jgi:hypothetical protein